MARRNHFDRLLPRHHVGGFYTSASSLNDAGAHSTAIRRLRQHHLHDPKIFSSKAFSSPPSPTQPPPPPPSSSLPPTAMPSISHQSHERAGSLSQSPSSSQLSPLQHQSSLDLVGASLKCDDCQTNDGLFQCCHCNQRLCIRCCNKHYKKVTAELEHLHELSDRLVAKIVHTKNDLERQKNETVEQCHKWRVDTINTINKAHTLIVQAIHNEYEILGKEYDSFVQKEMAYIHIDQNELIRMRKGNLGSLLASPSASTVDSTNSLDTIRKRIELFARNIDETGKFSFQVKLPKFDIDDSLRVESRFGDTTRSTSATWQNEGDQAPTSSTESSGSIRHVPSIDANDAVTASSHDQVIFNTDADIEELTDKINAQEFDRASPETTSSSVLPSSPTCESNTDTTPSSPPSSRYALSVENDLELQQQQFYRPSFRSDRYDSAYGTAPSSPSSSIYNTNDQYSSTSSLQDHSQKKFSYPSSKPFGSFYNNRRHTHTFQRQTTTPSPPPSPTSQQQTDNGDTYRSFQHVQLKREQDGSLEGMAFQFEQSQKTEGSIHRRRTCVEACGIRRRTTALPPRSPSSTAEGQSTEPTWLYYRTTSTPSFNP